MGAREIGIIGVSQHTSGYQGRREAEGEPECPKVCRREAQRLLRAVAPALGFTAAAPPTLTSLGGDPLRSPLLCDPILSEPALPQLLPPCFSRNLTCSASSPNKPSSLPNL